METEKQIVEPLSEKIVYWREVLVLALSLLTLYLGYVLFRKIIKPDENAKKHRRLVSATHSGNAKIIKKALQDIQINQIDQESMFISNQMLDLLNAYLYQAETNTTLTDKDKNRVYELAKQLNKVRTKSLRKERYALPHLYNY